MNNNIITKDTYYLFDRERVESDVNCTKESLSGESKLMFNPIIDEAFEKILDTYKPKHKKVIFSLCTSTRPYIISMKWKRFNELFGKDCDLIICSNGGIIPIEYMYCFPFMDYDAHRSGTKFDNLYKEQMMTRLTKFVEKFKWDTIVYSFLPTSRNAEALRESDLPGVLLPSDEVMKDIKENGCPGVNIMRYPQITTQALEEMAKHLNVEIPKIEKKRLF